MDSKYAVVRNQIGILAKPATLFVTVADRYPETSVWVGYDGRNVNGKSLVGLLSRAIPGGATIYIQAEGTQESEAVDALAKLVESSFEDY